MMSHYLPPQIVQGEQHPGLREGRGLGVLALPLVLAGPVEQAEPLHCGGDLLVLKRGGPDPKRAPLTPRSGTGTTSAPSPPLALGTAEPRSDTAAI